MADHRRRRRVFVSEGARLPRSVADFPTSGCLHESPHPFPHTFLPPTRAIALYDAAIR